MPVRRRKVPEIPLRVGHLVGGAPTLEQGRGPPVVHLWIEGGAGEREVDEAAMHGGRRPLVDHPRAAGIVPEGARGRPSSAPEVKVPVVGVVSASLGLRTRPFLPTHAGEAGNVGSGGAARGLLAIRKRPLAEERPGQTEGLLDDVLESLSGSMQIILPWDVASGDTP